MTTKPVEKLKEVFLDDSKLDRTTKIETLASPAVCQALTTEFFFFFWFDDDFVLRVLALVCVCLHIKILALGIVITKY